MVQDINLKLAGGWSPLIEQQNASLFKPMNLATEEFISIKKRELRQSTMVAYKSVLSILNNWIVEELHSPDCPASMFNHALAVRFMDFLFTEPTEEEIRKAKAQKKQPRKALSANAWNTYLKKYRAIFSWFEEHCYSKENPFERIKTKQKEEKRRGLIPAEVRGQIFDYCEENMPNYILVCMLIYYSLIRPKEIALIQLRDIHLDEGYILIPVEKAKTHIERAAPLSPELIERLKAMHLEKYPQDYYLLGTEYVPSEAPAYHGKYKKDWMKIREALHLPQEMQLYSFKDDGITEMIDDHNMNIHLVQQAAGHQDVTTTMKYARKIDPNMIEKIRSCGTSFRPVK
jgi:integrase